MGIDILDTFTLTFSQLRYLVVAVDYFKKWIEVEPLVKIITANFLKFFKKNVLARLGVPQSIVTNNGT